MPVSSSHLRLAEQLAAGERRAETTARRIDAVAAELAEMKRRRAEVEVRARLDALRESGRIEASEHQVLSRPENLAALAGTPSLLEAAEARPLRGFRVSPDQVAAEAAGRARERVDAILAEARSIGQQLSRLDAARQAAHELASG